MHCRLDVQVGFVTVPGGASPPADAEPAPPEQVDGQPPPPRYAYRRGRFLRSSLQVLLLVTACTHYTSK